MEVIRAILDQFFSVAIPEGIARGKEQQDQKRRLDRAQENLEHILISEQNNWYFDDLMRVLTNCTIMQDVVKGCLSGEPVPDIDKRISDLLLHERIEESKKSQIKSVINKLIKSIESAIAKPAEGPEARTAYQINVLKKEVAGISETVQKIKGSLQPQQNYNPHLSESEDYCEQRMDVSCKINQEINWVTQYRYFPVPKYHTPRENEEQTVENIITGNNKIAISGVVGGIGKTELLRLVCNKITNSHWYKYVGWINYSGNIATDIHNSLAQQYITNDDPIKNILTLDSQYGREMVLFVDNVDCHINDEHLQILSRLSCKIIVTTRNKTFFDFDMVPLGLLSIKVATDMFLAYRSQINPEIDCYVRQIIERCGYHPLALELVGKYAKKRDLNNEALYSEMLTNGFDLKGSVNSNWNMNKNEMIATQLSKLYKLGSFSGNQQIEYILRCFAILPSIPISKRFINCIVDERNTDYISFDALIDTGWISEEQGETRGLDEKRWYMHDVVKSIVKKEMTINIEDCSDFIDNLCQLSTNLIDYRVMTESLALLIGVSNFFSDIKSNNIIIKVYNDIGFVCQEISDYQNAKKWLERALKAFEDAEPSYDFLMLKGLVYNNLGTLHQKEFVRKAMSLEHISKDDLLIPIGWYDKSLKCYEALSQLHIYSHLETERKKLTTMNNKISCLYLCDHPTEALTLLSKVIQEKLQIVDQISAKMLQYYSTLLNDTHYSNMPVIIRGYSSLNAFISIIHKAYTPEQESEGSAVFAECNTISEIFNELSDYRFIFDNELIPSLICSYDLFACCQREYALELSDSDEIVYHLSKAYSAANIALDLCEPIEKITILEGNVWSTLSEVHYSWELKFNNIHSKNAAVGDQLNGIKILESIFREAKERQAKEALYRAYRNMYTYTNDAKWKEKANEIVIKFP